jgi:hypothetical protein
MLFSYSPSRNYFQALFLFLLCKQTLSMFVKIYKKISFYLENIFLTGLEHCMEYLKFLDFCSICFEGVLQKICFNSENRKRKREKKK